MRADSRAEVDARQAEVETVRAHSRDQAKQLSEMFTMLQVSLPDGAAVRNSLVVHVADDLVQEPG